MFYSLIKAHAALFFMQRKRHFIDGDGSFIEATLDDFEAAARLYRDAERDRGWTGDKADPA